VLEKHFGISIERNKLVNGIKIDGVIGNIGIEYNGMFWHSRAAEAAGFGKFNPNYHSDRCAIASQAGIKLIQIFEDEWLTKQPIVIARIAHALNKSTRIMARKCTINKISSNAAREFLKTHHINASVPTNFAVGLYHIGNLVAVATFGRCRFDKKTQDYELYRFALSCAITGGLSKLIKYASAELNASIVTYSDNLWGDGRGYRAAGFDFVEDIKPGYFYFDKKNFSRVSRQGMRKDTFFKIFGLEWVPSLTEQANAERVDCFVVFDAGKKKWRYVSAIPNK
jgi:hypothetical protein